MLEAPAAIVDEQGPTAELIRRVAVKTKVWSLRGMRRAALVATAPKAPRRRRRQRQMLPLQKSARATTR
eukprot:322462-Alexandrium_andersonii.AAC.1